MRRERKSAVTLRDHLSAEPFTLAMSSGFFAFFAHAGFVSALRESELEPAAYTGSSAGALVAGCTASGVAPSEIRDALFALKRPDFWDPAVGLGLLRGKLFRSRLEQLVPAAFPQTPLSISVFDLRTRRTHALTSGDLPAAIHASCAVPLMFHPVAMNGTRYADGGIADRPGIAGVPHGARLFYHHIASRSWWRPGVGALPIPSRPGMHSLVIEGLPRLGPNRLEGGPAAYRIAREATLRALDLPLRRVRRVSL